MSISPSPVTNKANVSATIATARQYSDLDCAALRENPRLQVVYAFASRPWAFAARPDKGSFSSANGTDLRMQCPDVRPTFVLSVAAENASAAR